MVYSFLYLLETGSADDVLDIHSQEPHSGHNFLKKSSYFPIAAWYGSQYVCTWVQKVLRQFGRRKVHCELLNIEVFFCRSKTPWSCQESGLGTGSLACKGVPVQGEGLGDLPTSLKPLGSTLLGKELLKLG